MEGKPAVIHRNPKYAMTLAQYEVIKQEAKSRWLVTREIFSLLHSARRLGVPLQRELVERPSSGTWFLYDSSMRTSIRKDGYEYARSVNGSGQKVYKERHIAFSQESKDVISCYYSSRHDDPNFTRSIYWLSSTEFEHDFDEQAASKPPPTDPEVRDDGCKGLIFVHYLDESSGGSSSSSYTPRTGGGRGEIGSSSSSSSSSAMDAAQSVPVQNSSFSTMRRKKSSLSNSAMVSSSASPTPLTPSSSSSSSINTGAAAALDTTSMIIPPSSSSSNHASAAASVNASGSATPIRLLKRPAVTLKLRIGPPPASAVSPSTPISPSPLQMSALSLQDPHSPVILPSTPVYHVNTSSSSSSSSMTARNNSSSSSSNTGKGSRGGVVPIPFEKLQDIVLPDPEPPSFEMGPRRSVAALRIATANGETRGVLSSSSSSPSSSYFSSPSFLLSEIPSAIAPKPIYGLFDGGSGEDEYSVDEDEDKEGVTLTTAYDNEVVGEGRREGGGGGERIGSARKKQKMRDGEGGLFIVAPSSIGMTSHRAPESLFDDEDDIKMIASTTTTVMPTISSSVHHQNKDENNTEMIRGNGHLLSSLSSSSRDVNGEQAMSIDNGIDAPTSSSSMSTIKTLTTSTTSSNIGGGVGGGGGGGKDWSITQPSLAVDQQEVKSAISYHSHHVPPTSAAAPLVADMDVYSDNSDEDEFNIDDEDEEELEDEYEYIEEEEEEITDGKGFVKKSRASAPAAHFFKGGLAGLESATDKLLTRVVQQLARYAALPDEGGEGGDDGIVDKTTNKPINPVFPLPSFSSSALSSSSSAAAAGEGRGVRDEGIGGIVPPVSLQVSSSSSSSLINSAVFPSSSTSFPPPIPPSSSSSSSSSSLTPSSSISAFSPRLQQHQHQHLSSSSAQPSTQHSAIEVDSSSSSSSNSLTTINMATASMSNTLASSAVISSTSVGNSASSAINARSSFVRHHPRSLSEADRSVLVESFSSLSMREKITVARALAGLELTEQSSSVIVADGRASSTHLLPSSTSSEGASLANVNDVVSIPHSLLPLRPPSLPTSSTSSVILPPPGASLSSSSPSTFRIDAADGIGSHHIAQAISEMNPEELLALDNEARLVQSNVRAWLVRRNYNLLKQAAKTLQVALRKKKKKFASKLALETRTSIASIPYKDINNSSGEKREGGGGGGELKTSNSSTSTTKMVLSMVELEKQQQQQQHQSSLLNAMGTMVTASVGGDIKNEVNDSQTVPLYDHHHQLVAAAEEKEEHVITGSSSGMSGVNPTRVNISPTKLKKSSTVIKNKASMMMTTSLSLDREAAESTFNTEIDMVRKEAEAASIIARALQRYRGY